MPLSRSLTRWLRWPLALLGGGLAAALFAVAAALLYAATPAGGKRLAELGSARVNDVISGHLRVDSARLDGTQVIVEGAELVDPDGSVVARVKRLEVTPRWFDLLSHRLRATRVRVTGPELRVVDDGRETNLARALAPRHPAPSPESSSTASPLSFQLDQFRVERLAVSWQTPDRKVSVRDVDGNVSGDWQAGDDRLRVDLNLDGQVTAPADGALSLEAHVEGSGGAYEGRVALDAAGAKLKASATATKALSQNPREPVYEVGLDELAVSPAWTLALSQGLLLQNGIHGQGRATLRGSHAQLALKLSVGHGKLSLEAAGDPGAPRVDTLHLVLRNIRASDVWSRAQPDRVSGEISGSVSGRSLDTLDGQATVELSAQRASGERMGPVEARASARDGHWRLERFQASLPGTRLEVQGRGTSRWVEGTAHLAGEDLERTWRALRRLTGLEVPMAGKADMTAQLRGRPERPSVALKGHAAWLRIGPNVLRDVELHASLPDVAHPLSAQASVRVAAMDLGGRRLTRVTLDATRADRTFDLSASVKGDLEVELQASGELHADLQGLRLRAFRVGFPEGSWRLENGPADLTVQPGRIALRDFTLRSGAQRLSLDGRLEGSRVTGNVDAEAVDLGHLPRALVPPRLALGGSLTARASVHGDLRHPEGKVEVHLEDGRFKRYEHLALSLDATYRHDRAKGHLQADAPGGIRVAADVDVPLSGWGSRREVPVRVSAQVNAFRVEDFIRAAELQAPWRGTVSGEVALTGTTRAPTVHALVRAEHLQYRQMLPAEVIVHADGTAGSSVVARIDASVAGREHFVQVETQWAPGADPLKARTRLSMSLHELPLPLLYTSGVLHRELLGTVSLEGDLSGTAASPRGQIRAQVAGVSLDGLPPSSGELTLALGAEEVSVEGSLRQGTSATATWNARARGLKGPYTRRDTWEGALWAVKIEGGPIAVAELQQLFGPEEPGEAMASLKGSASLALSGEGTVADPHVRAHVALNGLARDPAHTGDLSADYTYGGGHHHLEAALTSGDGKALRLVADGERDRAWGQTPVRGSIRSDGLDLGFLSGVVPQVRDISGRLVAHADVEGRLLRPIVAGSLEWKAGMLNVPAYGSFRDIHVAVNGDERDIELTDLSLRSETGDAHVTAKAQQTGSGHYALQSTLDLNRFPIIADSQLLASMTLHATANGTATSTVIDLTQVDVREARVDLPDVKRKDLTELKTPRDIVLVRNGRVLDRKKKTVVAATGASPTVMKVRAHLHAPRNLWVRGNDVNVELGLSDDFRFEYAREPHLHGRVEVIRGRADVFGRRFDLQRDSKVDFAGPVLEPNIDVAADYTNEQEDVVVHVKVSGQGKDIKVVPTSDPPLPETEIYTMLATGHRSLHSGSGTSSPAGAAASVVGSYAAGELKKTLASKLPLDVLSIQAGDQGLTGTKIEAGTYVNDRFYVGFTGRVGANPMLGENSNAAHVEYQLSRRWRVEAEYGDARAGYADLLWSKDY